MAEIRQLYFIIADISGYTKFVTLHKQSLLHAEKIIGNLLEAVISEAKKPLKVHELLGDAVSMYAPADDKKVTAEQIYSKIQNMYRAFNGIESSHISDCSMCACEACNNIDKLRLKVIAHIGEAAITKVGGIRKISGEDVILTHRWLKNSIPSHEYFLFSEEFTGGLSEPLRADLTPHRELLEGLGEKTAFYRNLESHIEASPPKLLNKLRKNTELNMHCLLRFFGKPKRKFLHLPE
jgi:Protein of unknown function (DUF2652)